MERLGINSEEHGANSEDFRNIYTKNGDVIFKQDFTRRHGTGRLIHRVDLYEALKEKATSEGVEIILSSPVEAVDPNTGSITLQSGNIN
jgi:2-polyprenyl-6-methoxyphenol hydroxylase-like FAD-dependent oxidoreductase